MNWKENINTIKEIFPGQFQIILDFATAKFAKYVISEDYKYVWVCNHSLLNNSTWEKRNLPLFDSQNNFEVIARHLNFDFILPTKEFIKILPLFDKGITAIQVNVLPKEYLDINKITGKTLYDLLTKDCDYLFELNIPSATDYGTLVSSNKGYLQSLLDNPSIDWNNLP